VDKRSRWRVPVLLGGVLFAHGCRTVTSWFRAASITDDFRQHYITVCAIGRKAQSMAFPLLNQVVTPLLQAGTLQAVPFLDDLLTPPPQPAPKAKRLLVGIDDTPTKRYGPLVEGAGIHRHPSPGPANEKHLYGHIWVCLAALTRHKDWGTIALPLQAKLYIRAIDIPDLPKERSRPFQTKLELAVEQLTWLGAWVKADFEERWAVVDGGYAKKNFLLPAKAAGWVVVGRLRKDAQLWDVPPAERRPGQRGPMPVYGKKRIYLKDEVADKDGWQEVQCEQYGQKVTKTVKTFLATWHPAGGLIRVVIVKEEEGWFPFFSLKAEASAAEVLEAMADRSSLEQMNKDVKEVWGADEQQVRNVQSNEGCFNINLWMYTLVEAWAWDKEESEVVDRSACPWDREWRRPSHADKRKALQRQIRRAEIQAVLSGEPSKEDFQALADRLLALAA
jgi:hypothetical protein